MSIIIMFWTNSFITKWCLNLLGICESLKKILSFKKQHLLDFCVDCLRAVWKVLKSLRCWVGVTSTWVWHISAIPSSVLYAICQILEYQNF